PVATTDGNMTLAQMHQFAAVLPKTLLIATPEWPESNAPEPAGVSAAKKAFFAAYKAAGITPDGAAPFSWDPGLLVVSALKKLGPNATAEQVRGYLADLKDFSGINGVYDFTKVPQRGLDDSSIVVTRWDKGQDKWVVVSKTRGIPLDK
ncbi:MAG TPA: hypothetical protein VL574_11980, partial [Stellaceae bacterium]|nr:hypothetical protein [Stellaceae bacterium]